MAGNLVHELGPLIKSMNEQCAQKFEALLTHILQADIKVTSTSEITQGYLKGSHDEHCFRTFLTTNKEKNRFAAFSTERNISNALLDLLCGGEGQYIEPTTHTEGPSPGEITILTKVATTLFECYEEIYAPIAPIKFAITSKAQDAEIELKSGQEYEYIITAIFTIITARTSGTFTISVPKSTIAKTGISNRLTNEAHMKAALEKSLSQVSLSLTAVIGQQETSLRKVTALQPGDIIPLGKPMDAEVYIADKHMCQARIVSGSSRLALQIVTENKEQDEQSKDTDDESQRAHRRTRARPSRHQSTQTESTTRVRGESKEPRTTRKRASTRGEK